MENLSPEEANKLLHFQELTGTEDPQRGIDLLQQSNWDLEIAVQSYFNLREGLPPAFNFPQPRMQNRLDVDTNSPYETMLSRNTVFTANEVNNLSRHQEWSLSGFLSFLILLPFRFAFSSLISLYSFVYSLFIPDPRLAVTDPLGDVNSFVDDFENSYGDGAIPNWSRVTYGQALNSAKQNIKLLLVYLHSDQAAANSQRFCRETLTNNEVVTFVNEHMMVWGCSVDSPEGYRVAKALKAKNYPFVCVIIPRNGKMTLIARSEGFIEANELLLRLNRIQRANEAILAEARAQKEERELNQTLRLQQDLDFQRSLLADQEKKRKREEAEEREQEKEEAAKRAKWEAEKRLEEIEKKKNALRDRIKEEPSADHPNAIKILLKLPNGQRLERRFLSTDSLEDLYNFVFVHEAAPNDFQIVTNYPRRPVPCQPSTENPHPPSFQEFGLQRAEMLFVHDNEA